jgi:saccharopine dehydrogenase-like NADP-dependent oxidoreductase
VAAALAADPGFERVYVVHRDPRRLREPPADEAGRIEIRKGGSMDLPRADVTVIAVPSSLRRAAATALAQGSHVVCACDDPSDVKSLLALDREASERGLTVAVGTVMAPGLSCVLAARLGGLLDRVDEVHVASVGTGGPACARRHHAALTGVAIDWEEGDWRRRPGGSGRELVWFPEPVGGADCYRGSLPDALLLASVFPDARRVTSRLKATRRDRLTSWLPMLRSPHPEGLVGAVRVELRGWLEGRAETKILGVSAPPAVAAATVSATAARWLVSGRLRRPGAGGLALLLDQPGAFLREVVLAGVAISSFEGQYGAGF